MKALTALKSLKDTTPLRTRRVKVTKIIAKDPLAIGGRPQGTIRDIVPEDYPRVCDTHIEPSDIKIWESKIKYYQSYIYDKQLQPGMIYEVKDGNLVPKVLEEATENLNKIRRLVQGMH